MGASSLRKASYIRRTANECAARKHREICESSLQDELDEPQARPSIHFHPNAIDGNDGRQVQDIGERSIRVSATEPTTKNRRD